MRRAALVLMLVAAAGSAASTQAAIWQFMARNTCERGHRLPVQGWVDLHQVLTPSLRGARIQLGSRMV